MRKLAIGIIVSITLFFSIPILALLEDPITSLREGWDFYLVMIFIPYIISIAILVADHLIKVKTVNSTTSSNYKRVD